jgi:ankyrin repeat protein
VSDEGFRLFYSAYFANLDYIKSLLIDGDINAYDYDGRTALGIAASEGHKHIVEYLVYHGANINHKDARGNDALADAIREGRQDVVAFLEEFKRNSS